MGSKRWTRRTRAIRALAVTGVFVVATGMILPANAPAQTPAQGQAVGIFLLLGASMSGAPASAKTPGQKPKPGIAASQKVEDGKQKPLWAKNRTVLANVKGERQ